MSFLQPTWFSGIIIWASYILIPIIIAIFIVFLGIKSKSKTFKKILMVISILCVLIACLGPNILWHYQFEVPSVSEKIITVGSWQPKAGIDVNENGLMLIDSADDLMMITATGEGFLNEENFLFFKFNTRDIYNQLKVNGTYIVKNQKNHKNFSTHFL